MIALEKRLLWVLVGCLAVAVANFIIAFPETLIVDGGCCAHGGLARDFSAYYSGAWRLLHNSWRVYVKSTTGHGGIFPAAEQYKYLPSFLVLVLPLLALPYQTALTVFDLFQLALLPVAAFLTYRLLEDKHLSFLKSSLVFVLILVQPFPLPGWGLSVSYFWQWAEGQAKVLSTVLLLLSFYWGSNRHVRLSAAAYALAFFDPRIGLIGLPVYLMYNRQSLRLAFGSLIASVGVANLSFLLPGVAAGFITMIFSSGLSTVPYPYTAIPLITIGVFWLLNLKQVRETNGIVANQLVMSVTSITRILRRDALRRDISALGTETKLLKD